MARVANGQGSPLRPGPRNEPSSFETAHGQPLSRTRPLRCPTAERTVASSCSPSRARPATTSGASHSAHAQVSVPEPPWPGAMVIRRAKGPSAEVCAVIAATTVGIPGSFIVRPRSVRNISLWKS